jgi:acyl transferase domain-containing protein
MNAAGVNPTIASLMMGHSTPERAAAAAAGAAGITLTRYTHALRGERARNQLDDFIAAALAEAREQADEHRSGHVVHTRVHTRHARSARGR